MNTKRQEQFGTGFRSVQRLRPWATVKVLMLLVLLFVSVQGAWAQTYKGIEINNVWYNYNGAVNGVQVTDVDDNATEVEIPETVVLNGDNVIVRGFYRDCKLKDKTNLKKVTIQAQMLMLDGEIFAGNTSIETVILPGSITYVRGAVFSGCTSLKRVMIPSGLPQVSGSLFSGCTSLVTIDIREGVTSIDASAFDGCTSLESVNVPSTITSIGNYAFRNCSSLRSIDVPAGVTTLNKETFKGCTSLATVNLHEGLQSIADETVFEGAGLTSLHIPSTLNADDAIKFNGCVPTLTSITVAPNHPTLFSPENSNAVMKSTRVGWSTTNELILGCKNTVIPNGATIGNRAFYNCTGLQTLVLPKSVTITGSAFAGCKNIKTIICTGYDPAKYKFKDSPFAKVPTNTITVLVPQSVVNTFRTYGDFRYFKAVDVDPSTIMNGFISDLELYMYPSSYNLQIPLDGKVANTTNAEARLAYDVSSRLSTAITDVRFVKSSSSNMPSELTIDGKKYTRGKSYVLNLGSKNYSVYYTTDGSNAPGTPLLKRLEIDNKNYTTPMTSKDYIRGVEIDQSGKVISQTPNPDWNESTPVTHYYIYVKAFYEPYSVPADEIHYTTSDNTKIAIASNAFGEGNTIKSHEYSNGEGVLVFNEPVTDELTAAFANQTKLTYVMLPAGINGISTGAFSGCTSLSGVMASGKLYRIGKDAFKNCVKLEKASLADWGVINIGTGAFEGCTGLQNVTIPSSIKSISANAFKGCSNIAKLTVSDKLESIGESAFEDCAKLTAFDIPYGAALKTIGSKAFRNTGFGYLNMANAKKLTDLGTYAFASCQNLYMVRIGSLDRIPAYLFDGCRLNTKSFTVENYNGTMADVDANAFDKSKIEHIELLNADNVTAIPDNKFKDYTALKYFNFWGVRNLTSIGKNAFDGTILGSVNLAACGKLKSIGQYAFANNPQMSRLELPSSLEEIQTSVFQKCTSLTTVNLPESIKTISPNAFYGCSSLKTLMLNKGLSSIGASAFAGSSPTLEVIANLGQAVSVSNTNCFDDAVYAQGTLRKVGSEKDNSSIYGREPWSKFQHIETGSDFYLEESGATYRIYNGDFKALDGRMLSGAELVSTSTYTSESTIQVKESVSGYPVIAIASGAITFPTASNTYLIIPGSVVSIADNIVTNEGNLVNLEFRSGPEPLYMENPMRFSGIHSISLRREIKCLNNGPFDGLKVTHDKGVKFTICEEVSSLQEGICKNSDVTEITFKSRKRFSFPKEAFRGASKIAKINVETSNASEGMDEDNPQPSVFDDVVYRNAVLVCSGPKKDEYEEYYPWYMFRESQHQEVTLWDGRYRIYAHGSYSYDIKDDFGVHNLTGAVLIGGDFGGPVEIPDKVDGFPVIAVAKGVFNEKSNITSISFPGTLRMIENNAVEKMENLKKVVFRDQLFPHDQKCYVGYAVYSVVDEEAFYKCDALEEVSIGCNIDWEGSEDEPFEDRDNLKTVRITKGCHQIGKDGDHSNDRLFNLVWNIENIIIEDSDEPLEIYGNHEEESFVFDMLDLKYCYMGRDCKNTSMGRLFWWDRKNTTTDVMEIGPKVTEYNQDIKIGKTLRFSEGNILKKIAAGVFSGSSNYVVEGYCPNLEVIEDNAFNKNQFNRCFWFDPRHPEESHLRKIGNCAINLSKLDNLYLPPTMEYVGENNGYTIKNVYIYSEDLSKLNIDKKFVQYDGDIDKNFSSEITFHFLCSHNGDPGKYTTNYWDDQGLSVDDYDNKFDIHSWKTKKGVIQSSGLYSEVCAGCGGDDNRSVSTGNYYIHNWNGSDDIMIHKSGSSYTYAGPLAIDDSKPFQSPVSFSAQSVTYNRTVTGGRVATFILPFATQAWTVNGKVYKFREFKDNKFCFDEQTGALNANTPYLVVLNEDATELLNSVSAKNLAATVSSSLSPLDCKVTGGTAEHIGTFKQQTFTDGQNGKSYYGYDSKDGAFVKAKTATLNPFRTMFTLSQSSNANARIRLQLGDDDIDGIIEVDADELDGNGSRMYDLNGRVITSPVHGQIYIQNGKKISSK